MIKKRVVTLGLSIVLLVVITIVALNVGNDSQENHSAGEENNVEPLRSVEHDDINFIRGADTNIEFDITVSKSGKARNFVEIYDQNKNKIDPIVLPAQDGDYFIVKSPIEGYIGGYTYTIELKEGADFSDSKYEGKRELAFTIKRDEVLEYELSDGIKVYDQAIGILNQPINNKLTFNTMVAGFDLNDVVIFDVYESVGGKEIITQNAFRILEIILITPEKTIFSVESPELEEVFSHLDVSTNLDINEENIFFRTNDEIKEQLSNTEFFRNLLAVADAIEETQSRSISTFSSKRTPPKLIVEANFNYIEGGVEAALTISLENLIYIKKIDSYFNLKIHVSVVKTMTGDTDFNVFNGSFSSGYEIKSKLSINLEGELTRSILSSDEDEEKEQEYLVIIMVQMIAYFVENEEESIAVFELTIVVIIVPIPVPGLTFKCVPTLVYSLDIKASLEIGISVTHTSGSSSNRSGDGVDTQNNNSVVFALDKISLRGSLEFRFGIEVFVGVSLINVLDLGIEGEIGIYVRLAASVEIYNADLNVFMQPNWHFEIGLYAKLVGVFKINLVVWNYEGRIGIIDFEQPLFSVGNRKKLIIKDPQSVTFQHENSIIAPTIFIDELDFYTGEKSQIEVAPLEYSRYFKFQDTQNLALKNGTFNLLAHAGPEFEEKFPLSLRTSIWRFEIGRPILEIEFNNINVDTEISITRIPIPIENIDLQFSQIVDDPNYESLYGLNENTPYILKGESDYQISRLVLVTPIITPANASFQTLDFDFISGNEFIEVIDIPQVINRNGVSTFVFRVIFDEKAIGNEINVRATSNGYIGQYQYMNISNSNGSGIVPTAIPAEHVEFNSAFDNTGGQLFGAALEMFTSNSINAVEGTIVKLKVSKTIPTTATRGAIVSEGANIVQGNASISIINDEYEIIVNENEPGSQIKVLYRLGNLVKEYYINVQKKAVESINITGDRVTLYPGESMNIVANLLSGDGEEPTINDVKFILLKGNNLVELSKNAPNNATITANQNANSDLIEVVAIADGTISPKFIIEIKQVPVNSLVISSTKTLISASDVIYIESSIDPMGATGQIEYHITKDESTIALIDKYNGTLIINSTAKFGDIVKVIAQVDGIYSNELTFIVEYVQVEYLLFATLEMTLAPGDEVNLEKLTLINQNATNKEVNYSLYSGTHVSIINGILIISEFASLWIDDTLKITSVDRPDLVCLVDILIEPEQVLTKFSPYYELVTTDSRGITYNSPSMKSIEARLKPTDSIELFINNRIPGNLLNTAITFEIIGAASLIDTSEFYYSLHSMYPEGTRKVIVTIDPTALVGDVIVVKALYDGNSVEFRIHIITGITDVILDHNEVQFNVGDEYQFTAIVHPTYLNSINSIYALSDPSDSQFIELSSDGYAKFISPNIAFIQKAITIRVMTPTFMSRVLTIYLNNEIKSVDLLVNYSPNGIDNSHGVSVIENGETSYYVLNPGGEMYIRYSYTASEKMNNGFLSPKFELCEIGEQYLNFDYNSRKITVKNTGLSGGVFASFVAYVEGVVSEPIMIYIPNMINTFDDFSQINNNVFGYYVLTNDIDLRGETIFIPEFHGFFDGNGFKILNFTLNVNATIGSYGLFGTNYGTILNFILADAKIQVTGHDYNIDKNLFVGGVVGENHGSIAQIALYNVVITATNEAMNLYLGGISGINSGIIEKCIIESTIRISIAHSVGGITGINVVSGIIIDCRGRSRIIVYRVHNVDSVSGANEGIIRGTTGHGSVELDGKEIKS